MDVMDRPQGGAGAMEPAAPAAPAAPPAGGVDFDPTAAGVGGAAGGGAGGDHAMTEAEAAALATQRAQRPEPEYVDLTADSPPQSQAENDAERDLNAAIAASLRDPGAGIDGAGLRVDGVAMGGDGATASDGAGGSGAGAGNGDMMDAETLAALGVDAEEARMLEAAMFGAEGTKLSMGYAATVERAKEVERRRQESAVQAEQFAPPEVRQQRSIRAEQDAAYAASLAADREKEAAARRERQAAEAAAAAQREAETTAAAAEAQKAREAEEAEAAALRRREEAAARLPVPPESGAEGAISCVVRLPQGGRLSRVFASANLATTLFDWLAAEGADGGNDGAQLVMQFPRRVLERASLQGTLADMQLSKQEAFLLQLP